MTEGFSRESIKEKQRIAQEEYEKNLDELRKTIKLVAETESGLKFLEYLFLLTGGQSFSLRRDKEGTINPNETLVVAAVKGIWETISLNMEIETLVKIERRQWEK
jgi:hypothetical protein